MIDKANQFYWCEAFRGKGKKAGAKPRTRTPRKAGAASGDSQALSDVAAALTALTARRPRRGSPPRPGTGGGRSGRGAPGDAVRSFCISTG